MDSARHAWVRRGLVVAEIALAAVLLVGAGLLAAASCSCSTSSWVPRRSRDRHTHRVQPTTEPDDLIAILGEVYAAVSSLPGVEAAGLSDALPLDRNRTWSIMVPGKDYQNRQLPLVFVYVVSPGYFRGDGHRRHAGADFLDRDVGTDAAQPNQPAAP